MRVLMIAHNPPYQGGIVQASVLLANALAGRIHLEVIGYRSLYPRFLYKGVIPRRNRSGIRFAVPFRRILRWWDPFSWWEAAGCARGFDILHLHYVTAFLAPLYFGLLLFVRLRAPGVRTVLTCHNITDHERLPFQGLLTRALFRRIDRFIVHAAENRERLRAHYGIPAEAVEVIPHGDFSFFRRWRGADPSELRRQFGVDGKKVLLFFGYIRPYKGLRYLLRAMPSVLRAHGDAHLLIAGECWHDPAEERRLIDDLGIRHAATFHPGYVPDPRVHEYFDAADIVVLPYFNTEQTISGPLLVAMTFGKPIVVCSSGGIANLVENDVDAVLCEGGDPEGLAREINALLDDPARAARLGRTAAERVRRHDWDRSARAHRELYERLGPRPARALQMEHTA
ncbi:MAG: glycosyltransferase [Planctomycetes bacterium]|nr:glycosyltransferase [Planctomycetota bacterium]